MLVTKKRLYTELCKVMDHVHELISIAELEKRNRRLADEDIKERINYTLQKVLDLTDRVEALEAKKQHKTTKKQTKKTKGK